MSWGYSDHFGFVFGLLNRLMQGFDEVLTLVVRGGF